MSNCEEFERLRAINAIALTKARYFRAVDTKDWELLREVFAPDFVGDFRGAATDPLTGFNPVPDATNEVLYGADATIAAFVEAGRHFQSVHHGLMPEITIEGPENASGVWALFDMLRFHEGPVSEMIGYGHYHETYRRTDGSWRIASSRLTRLRVECTMRASAHS